MKLADQSFLFLDCQTTGATPQSAQILELGWFLPPFAQAQSELAIKTRLIRLPDDQVLPPRIERITGINAEIMQDALLAADVVSELMRDLGQIQGQRPIRFAIAHYAQFEQAFVNQLFAEHLPGQNLPFQFICTCQIAKRLYPDLPSRAIRALGGYFGLSLSEMKRSSCHVEATYFIWQRLQADLAALGIDDDDQLLEWLRQPLPKVAAKAKRNPYAMPMERLKRLDLPASPGVYRMLNCEGKILYVGKATSLKSRVNSYFRGRKGKDSKTKELISQIFDIAVEVVATPLEAAMLETDLIKAHDPPYNRALRQRGRVLNFYSHDLAQVSAQQDAEHMLGPFVSDSMKPLLDLLHALQRNTQPLELFWGLASAELIAKAFALVLSDGPLAFYKAEQLTARRLLAIGMVHVRQEVNCMRAFKREQDLADDLLQSAETAGQVSGEGAGAAEDEIQMLEMDIEQEVEPEVEREIDENDVVEMIFGILARSARLHLQAKRLTSMLNAHISFCDSGVSRELTFINGRCINSQLSSSSSSSEINQPAWFGLDINCYDRMRVLLTELARVTLKDKAVRIVDLRKTT
ncbi:MAG: GIY-YIG nuclease family protein [Candidatus Melainabacteria bacterium]|nr:GIY-YIG nuclease family protein [Candidatus Melainabacteria bacterium]